MAYKKNYLWLARCPLTSPHECEEADHDPYGDEHHWIYDSRDRSSVQHTDVAYLPHSCDSWVIGGVEEMRLLIQDLQKAINILEGNE